MCVLDVKVIVDNEHASTKFKNKRFLLKYFIDINLSFYHRSFVSITVEGNMQFNAEEFTDPTELRSLAEMLGPYGIKLLNETLMWHIQSQVTELRKLVVVNKEILIALRTNFDKPEMMKELFKRLQNVDSVLQRMTIIGKQYYLLPKVSYVITYKYHIHYYDLFY